MGDALSPVRELGERLVSQTGEHVLYAIIRSFQEKSLQQFLGFGLLCGL